MENESYRFKILNLSDAKKELLATTIGLVRASAENNASTENTERLISDALLKMASGEDRECGELLADIRKEKGLLAPDCATCANPCGRTADYPVSEFAMESASLQVMKARMLFDLIARLSDKAFPMGMERMLRMLFMFGYEKDAEQFKEFLDEMNAKEE